MGSLRKIRRELKNMEIDPPTDIQAGPTTDNLHLWQATILGPPNTPYEGGTYSLTITLPKEYPFAPPKITFQTPLYHPNFKITTNMFCCCNIDILYNEWSPRFSIVKILERVR